MNRSTGRMSNSESVALLPESAGEAAQNSNRSRSRKRSAVWQYFEELPNEGKAICIHCGSKFAYHKGIGISHLQNHIRTSCKELPPDIDRNSIFPKSVSSLDVRNFVLDPKLVRDFMTKFWITGNIAFRKIENVFFKRMMRLDHPSLEVHGKHSRMIACQFTKKREKRL